MQSIWPRFQPSSVHYCSSESQTSTLRLSARVTLVGGRSNTQTSRHTCTCMHTHIHKHFLSTSHTVTHTQSLLSFLSLTHNLTSPGIRSFYRAAACWRGRRYGRAVSPSSDWISDQYPVPRRPASSCRTDCFWKSVLVVSRLPALIKDKKSGDYLPSSNICLSKGHNFVTPISYESCLNVGCL